MDGLQREYATCIKVSLGGLNRVRLNSDYSDLYKIMRSNLSHFGLLLTAIVGLTAVGLAQTEEPAEPAVVQNPQLVEVHFDLETTNQIIRDASPGMLKKLEDWVGLTDKRLEDLTSTAEKILAEVAKMKKLRSEATSVMSKQAQAVSSPPTVAESPSAPTPPAAASPPQVPQAEIGNAESFDSISGDTVGETAPVPVLGSGTPDWVKKGLVLGDEHSLAISSTLMPDVEQCREDLKSRMMSEVRMYLNKHVLEYNEAMKLPELTQEYVEKYWVKKGQEFDNIQDRPSGTYHQLWIGLHISSEQLTKIREWEKQGVRELRMKKVGIFGGIGVFAVTLLSGAVGLLARREKAKLNK